MTGTDISERSIERARAEAARAGAGVAFSVADFRDLTAVESEFDVVISCDNAIPRLLDDADIATALRAMHAKVRPHGLLVITVRDYDALLAERTPLAPPVLIDGPPRRVFLRMHDWDAPDSPLYTVRFFVLTETESGWTLSHHSARYRAITKESLGRAAEATGFEAVTWIPGAAAGFHQPVMTARRATVAG